MVKTWTLNECSQTNTGPTNALRSNVPFLDPQDLLIRILPINPISLSGRFETLGSYEYYVFLFLQNNLKSVQSLKCFFSMLHLMILLLHLRFYCLLVSAVFVIVIPPYSVQFLCYSSPRRFNPVNDVFIFNASLIILVPSSPIRLTISFISSLHFTMFNLSQLFSAYPLQERSSAFNEVFFFSASPNNSAPLSPILFTVDISSSSQ